MVKCEQEIKARKFTWSLYEETNAELQVARQEIEKLQAQLRNDRQRSSEQLSDAVFGMKFLMRSLAKTSPNTEAVDSEENVESLARAIEPLLRQDPLYARVMDKAKFPDQHDPTVGTLDSWSDAIPGVRMEIHGFASQDKDSDSKKIDKPEFYTIMAVLKLYMNALDVSCNDEDGSWAILVLLHDAVKKEVTKDALPSGYSTRAKLLLLTVTHLARRSSAMRLTVCVDMIRPLISQSPFESQDLEEYILAALYEQVDDNGTLSCRNYGAMPRSEKIWLSHYVRELFRFAKPVTVDLKLLFDRAIEYLYKLNSPRHPFDGLHWAFAPQQGGFIEHQAGNSLWRFYVEDDDDFHVFRTDLGTTETTMMMYKPLSTQYLIDLTIQWGDHTLTVRFAESPAMYERMMDLFYDAAAPPTLGVQPQENYDADAVVAEMWNLQHEVEAELADFESQMDLD
ncbi:Hypothetical protein D9617_18g032640 [Elsinoe fawcettii]|nr:Hypothetical protein D9617_18g032640 [Elsinoe fawcettii]